MAEQPFARILISGSRNMHAPNAGALVNMLFMNYGTNWGIIEGGAKGFDTAMRRDCRAAGVMVATVEAQWKFHGKKAGPLRNVWMLHLQPQALIFCHHDLGASKGTRHMVRSARQHKILVLRWIDELKTLTIYKDALP